MHKLNSAQRATLEEIFANPTSSRIQWARVKSLLQALGAEVVQGRGSRIKFFLGDGVIRVHEPHEKDTPKWMIEGIREFLEFRGIIPK